MSAHERQCPPLVKAGIDQIAVEAVEQVKNTTTVNYADAVDCPYVCSIGRRSCPWECVKLGGRS
jgi:hypothetical protein